MEKSKKELLNEYFSLNIKEIFLGRDCTTLGCNCPFEITPREFLVYAKNDFEIKDIEHSCINALCNSKRAIDCQIDTIISHLGFNLEKFEKGKYEFLNNFIKQQKTKSDNRKLAFIEAFEIAPIFLVSKLRKMRNEVEHDYKLPTKEQTKEAIEIAELFVNATENVFNGRMFTDIIISSDNERTPYGNGGFNISFDNWRGNKTVIKYSLDKEKQVILNETDEEYIYTLQFLITNDAKCLKKIFNIKSPNFPKVNYYIC